MIKDIDNAIIIEANINTTDAETAKDGDIVVYNTTAGEWNLCKSGLTLTNAVFGVVCDTNEKATKRLICIDGIIEANIAEAGHPPFSLFFFYSNTNYVSFTASVKRIENGYLIKYLDAKYGQVRGLIKIENNTNYVIAIT